MNSTFSDMPHVQIKNDVEFGKNVKIFGFVNLFGCRIGDETRIGPFVEIQKGAIIGKKVKVQSHSFICEGVEIHDEVFIGHGVMFTNDLFPRSTTRLGELKGATDWKCDRTIVGRRASIGSNATILAGITIGDEAIIGAGAVVTKDVPKRAVVAGNPARILRFLKDDDV